MYFQVIGGHVITLTVWRICDKIEREPAKKPALCVSVEQAITQLRGGNT